MHIVSMQSNRAATMSARRIFSGVGTLGGLETKVCQQGPGVEPSGDLGALPPEADEKL